MLNWEEAKKELDLKWNFKLLKLFPKGLQPYSCKDEGVKKISCPHECHAHALKVSEWRKIRRQMEMFEAQGDVNIADMDRLEKTENRIMGEAKVISSKDPDLSSWEFYVHPETNEGVKDVLSYLKKEGEVCFRPEDVERLKKDISKKKGLMKAKEAIEPGTEKEFDETLIRPIKVSYENDNEIKIQLPRKKAETPSCRELGFRDNTTKAWKTLINILEESPHIFNLGLAHTYSNGNKQRVKDYDRNRNLLYEIDKKLKYFLSQRFEVQVPDDYKLYERCKNEKSGTYKFKFQVVSAYTIKRSIKNKYENLSEDKLIKMLIELYEEHQRAPNDTNIAKMHGMSELLISKFKYTQADIKKMLETEKEDTRYDQFENVKDKEKDY